MSVIVWNDKLYGIGIAELDQQHKKLIDMINELHLAIAKGEQNEVVGDVLSGLADYIRFHFSEEEDLMKKMNFPEFARHKSQHAMFITKVTNILKRMKRGQSVSAFELCSFLKQWLVNHICVSDRKIAESVATLVNSTS